jgi:hypothetical protein
MNAIVPDEVIVMDRGGGRARRVPVANVACSWSANAAGTFSAFTRISDLRAVGLGGSLAGRWIEWTHPTAGRWGGVISGRTISDGIPELAADGWASLLRGRVIVEQQRPPAASPGTIARHLVLAAGREQPTFLSLGTFDEGGEPVSVALGSGDVLDDLLPSITKETGFKWRVDAARRFHFGRNLGRDRSGSVRLVEGRHIVDYRADEDQWSMRLGQRIRVESAEAFARRATRQIAGAMPHPARVTDPRAGSANDRLLETLATTMTGSGLLQFLDDAPTRIANEPRSQAVWANYLPLTTPLSITVADVDACWRAFDVGDRIRVDLGSGGFAGTLEVMERGLDAAAGTMIVSGDAMVDW